MRNQLYTNIALTAIICLLAALVLENTGLIEFPRRDVRIVSIRSNPKEEPIGVIVKNKDYDPVQIGMESWRSPLKVQVTNEWFGHAQRSKRNVLLELIQEDNETKPDSQNKKPR